MTSTPVKDAGFLLSGVLSPGASQRSPAGPGFQSVLDGQTQREASAPKPREESGGMKKTPGESLKAKDDHQSRLAERKTREAAAEETGEGEVLSEEKLREAAEAFSHGAAKMLEQLAQTLGVTKEQAEQAMAQLGLEAGDLLDESGLTALFLNLSGAEDSCALVTDDGLYESYQALLAGLREWKEQTQGELALTPGQLQEALKQMEKQTSEEAAPAVQTKDQTALIQTEGENPEPETETELKTPLKPQTEQLSEGAEEVSADPAGKEPEKQSHTQSGEREAFAGREGSEGKDRAPVLTAVSAQDQRTLFQPQTQQTGQTQTPWRTDAQDILRQILDYMKIQVKPGDSSLEMQLHPESLGRLHIQIASKGGAVTANFITQNEAVKAALESQMVQLRESFEQQGVKVEAIEVTIQPHAFEQNLEQGRGRGGEQSQTPKKLRIRRLDLNLPLEEEELGEEDRLAAQMMAANGNQVDYTA